MIHLFEPALTTHCFSQSSHVVLDQAEYMGFELQALEWSIVVVEKLLLNRCVTRKPCQGLLMIRLVEPILTTHHFLYSFHAALVHAQWFYLDSLVHV